MSSAVKYIIILFTVFMSAFFSGSELSMTTLNKLRLGKQADDGDKRARMALKISSNYDRMLSGVLIGNNLVNILCSSVATLIFLTFIKDSGVAATVSTVVMTTVILIFGEIVPKLVAKNSPDRFAKAVAYPLQFIIFLLSPLVYLSLAIIRLLGRNKKKNKEEEPSVTEDDLVGIIETVEEEGVIDEKSSDMLQSAIEFKETTLAEILTPRTAMLTIDVDDDPAEILDIAMKSTYSRIPVYEDSIDNIIGVLYLNHYFKKISEVGTDAVDLRSMLVEAPRFHKAMHLPAALRQMRDRQLHLAIVIDEYGGTLGLVTLEDILEEIVGDIWDESDEIKTEMVKTAENTYDVSGDMNVYDFFEELGVSDRDFESDYTTVGGWAIEMLEGEPHEGDSFEYKNLYVLISEMEEMRVVKLTVIVRPEPEEEENE
ncbi:MAG: hemolysin family protein [Eubacteriales bacterium]|nr:hemolysin family protein [Eubacteriales bacterium]